MPLRHLSVADVRLQLHLQRSNDGLPHLPHARQAISCLRRYMDLQVVTRLELSVPKNSMWDQISVGMKAILLICFIFNCIQLKTPVKIELHVIDIVSTISFKEIFNKHEDPNGSRWYHAKKHVCSEKWKKTRRNLTSLREMQENSWIAGLRFKDPL